SHVTEGTVTENDRTDVVAIHFKETPPHSAFDWHEAPEPQYVITLSGTLEFTTRDGETFVLRPGDVLVATDDVGSGHKWRLIDEPPWRRAYVVPKPGARQQIHQVGRTETPPPRKRCEGAITTSAPKIRAVRRGRPYAHATTLRYAKLGSASRRDPGGAGGLRVHSVQTSARNSASTARF